MTVTTNIKKEPFETRFAHPDWQGPCRVLPSRVLNIRGAGNVPRNLHYVSSHGSHCYDFSIRPTKPKVWPGLSYYPYRVRFSPVTSVPYWDCRCDEKFTNFRDAEEWLDTMFQQLDHYSGCNEVDRTCPDYPVRASVTPQWNSLWVSECLN